MMLKMLDLFSGMAGFSYTADKLGITTTAFCEIDTNCHKVLSHNWQGVPIYADVCQVNGAEIEPVDIVTFGSPCQDLSVAGKRGGLEGERSGLFMEAVRVIREMRKTTGGKCPTFCIWENVPGAFSSNKGADFRTVLESLTEAEIPMPQSGKWADAGLVRGNGREIAWRVLDAQYWGVPQRRKRIFLVADFGGNRAAEILFKPEGLSRYSAESRSAREEAATCIEKGINEPSGINGKQDPCCYGNQVGTLDTYPQTQCVAVGLDMYNQCLTGNVSRTVKQPLGGDDIPCVVLADQGGSQMDVLNNLSPTLRAQEHGHQPLIMDKPICFEPGAEKRMGGRTWEDLCPTLRAEMGDNQPAVAQCLTTGTVRRYDAETETLIPVLYDMTHADEVIRPVEAGLSPTLNSRMGTGGNQVPVMLQRYAVRRLTPLECLRLQGFPDTWLDIEGLSDSAKYRMIGNSVAIPCVEFVLSGIKREAEANRNQ